MLNPTSLLADALGRNLAETYRRIYGDQEPHIAAGLDEAARLVIERIASSDALYHDCEHTALVTLCVQDILHGRAFRDRCRRQHGSAAARSLRRFPDALSCRTGENLCSRPFRTGSIRR